MYFKRHTDFSPVQTVKIQFFKLQDSQRASLTLANSLTQECQRTFNVNGNMSVTPVLLVETNTGQGLVLGQLPRHLNTLKQSGYECWP